MNTAKLTHSEVRSRMGRVVTSAWTKVNEERAMGSGVIICERKTSLRG